MDRLPSIALAGTSAPVELVLALAVQPVSARGVSVAAEAGVVATAAIATGTRPRTVAIAANAAAANLARLRRDTKWLMLLFMPAPLPSAETLARPGARAERQSGVSPRLKLTFDFTLPEWARKQTKASVLPERSGQPPSLSPKKLKSFSQASIVCSGRYIGVW